MPSESNRDLPILVTLALIVLALVYVIRWYRLRPALPAVITGRRLAAFMSGVFLLWVALGSPLEAMDDELLTFHMLQHLLLMTVAAPLLLIGSPPIMLPKRLLRCLPVHISNHQALCWLASTLAVIGWHVPALFELAMTSGAWHVIEQACFFAAGLLFWLPVLRPVPQGAGESAWSVPLYLFLATLPCDALSAFLAFCNRVVYSHYLSTQRLAGISPLGDQELAGALMWVWVTLAYLAPAAVFIVRMLSPRPPAFKAKPALVRKHGIGW